MTRPFLTPFACLALLIGSCVSNPPRRPQDAPTTTVVSEPVFLALTPDAPPEFPSSCPGFGPCGDLFHLPQVFFTFNSIRPASGQAEILAAIVRKLRDCPTVSVIVEGRTDDRGTEVANLLIARRRADSVRDYLAAHGISPDRLTPVAFGSRQPIYPDGRNRCVSFRRDTTRSQ